MHSSLFFIFFIITMHESVGFFRFRPCSRRSFSSRLTSSIVKYSPTLFSSDSTNNPPPPHDTQASKDEGYLRYSYRRHFPWMQSSIFLNTFIHRDCFTTMLKERDPVMIITTDTYTIINDPHVTFKHPVIDVDISEYASRILSSNREASPRFKPLFAVVTGVGRGKTRTLVEIQRELNKKSNVLCHAMTFNSYWKEILYPTDFLNNDKWKTRKYAYI